MTPLFSCRLNVRTYECDLYGHVNNATYLNYLEYARMEFLQARGFTLHGLKDRGLMTVVVRIDCQYKAPALPHDDLRIDIYLSKTGNSSGVFRQIVVNEKNNKVMIEADVTWVFTNLSGKPVGIPKDIKKSLLGAE